ncbi:fibronectin type III domain-containing protein 9 [Clinocottus analis]|uniref:fibronectin type III domain-containing protein 9 n=1 Tax=Clinocottus analis TaxID=304258 RepID=UPI0035BF032D
MGVAVYNVSATSARVSWPPSPGCLDTFYSVMYDPNWNSLLMGYKRKSFLHEERIPVSQTSAHLANLLPQTAYFLCVTCQAANPVRDQCQVFSTPSDSGEGHERAGWELAAAAWLTCCVLLLVIAGILLWGCLHAVCSVPDGCRAAAGSSRRGTSGSGRLYAAPRRASEASGKHAITQDHELRTLAKLSGSEPV